VRTYFAKTLFAVLAVFTVLFAAELTFELWRAGFPGPDHTSWVEINNAKLVDLLSPIARAYNNILAMLIATIGLAIPLTANMHTPKLIEMFIRDRLNQAVLFGGAFFAANVLWVDYIVGPHFAPTIAIAIAVGGALVGWAILIPYFFYVVRFLDPSNILKRLEEDVVAVIAEVRAGKLDPNTGQAKVHERLQEIGTIVIKSLDRTDRDIALEGIWILKRLLDHHGEAKSKMPAGWFVVGREDFIGLSNEALELVQEERVFFERKVLQQLLFAYTHAIGKAPDVASSVSDANRVVAEHAAQRGDETALAWSIRYFNSFLRESIRAKHIHSLYDVFLQYRLLAEHLHDRPALMRSVAQQLVDYAIDAQNRGMPAVPSFAAFDLAAITLDAFVASKDVASDVLAAALKIAPAAAPNDGMVIEARIKLGGALLGLGEDDAAARVKASLEDIGKDVLDRCAKELLDSRRVFHEITDRQVDFRYIAKDQRPHVERFVAMCKG
jgi:hypothetical protein